VPTYYLWLGKYALNAPCRAGAPDHDHNHNLQLYSTAGTAWYGREVVDQSRGAKSFLPQQNGSKQPNLHSKESLYLDFELLDDYLVVPTSLHRQYNLPESTSELDNPVVKECRVQKDAQV
jgi:hypothetical protein